ncbi:ROK family protein [Eubacteriales bacterium OttesenSCG-928-A19]|nr:ROK family protein [Eubacteriales bacterium OttesenSCG-928-A19]
MSTFLGVDIGGTAVKIGLVDGGGALLRKAEHSVDYDGYRTPILTSVLQAISVFLSESGARPEGIGISAAGQVDVHSGAVVGTCGNLPGWEGTRLTDAMRDAFSLPAVAMNDANCALLGEQWVGAAKGRRHVVMITLGTGVGGGILVDGRILNGREGLAGELGHMPLHAGGIQCTCGNRGCYEQYASVTALVRRAAVVGEDAPRSGRAVFDSAATGNERMLGILSEWIEDVASGLVGLIHLLNPELLLIGGGVSAQDDLLIRPLRERVLGRTMPRFREGLELEAAALGNDAGMLGAVRHLLNRHG